MFRVNQGSRTIATFSTQAEAEAYVEKNKMQAEVRDGQGNLVCFYLRG